MLNENYPLKLSINGIGSKMSSAIAFPSDIKVSLTLKFNINEVVLSSSIFW